MARTQPHRTARVNGASLATAAGPAWLLQPWALGSMITLGPGIAAGRHSVIAASVCTGSSSVPAAGVLRSSSPEAVIEARRT
ncbi:hypothetical protein ACFY04_28620 [Streptomyces sp. NPDC001549]|uniref:hypothetical protein n=1 Tax=Streptomyces sp. NPDC001549 TaxID=3364586 RepID=UPI0036750852